VRARVFVCGHCLRVINKMESRQLDPQFESKAARKHRVQLNLKRKMNSKTLKDHCDFNMNRIIIVVNPLSYIFSN
jgi:hypothetical protein